MAQPRSRKNQQGRKLEILSLLLFLLGLFILLSLISYDTTDWPNNSNRNQVGNWMGLAGAWISYYLFNFTIGYPILVLPFLVIYLGWVIIKRIPLLVFLRRSGYVLFFALCFSVAFALPQTISRNQAHFDHEFNGLIGLFFAEILHRYLGSIGSVMVLFTVLIVAFLSLTDVSISGLIVRFGEELILLRDRFLSSLEQLVRRRKLKKDLLVRQKTVLPRRDREPEETPAEPLVVSHDIPVNLAEKETDEETGEPFSEKAEPELEPEPADEEENEEIAAASEETPPAVPPKKVAPKPEREEVTEVPTDYRLPGPELLDMPAPVDREQREQELLKEARLLEEKLAIYGIEARVMQIHPGPVITQFEVQPAEGIKISKFLGIADDLAMVMRAKQIRIQAPIPGKAAVGIEVPNREPQTISFARLVLSDEFKRPDLRLPIALGVDTTGKPYLTDLTRMPHLLIAGSTGSGKSVCLNTIIASFLYRLTPRDLRLILIDPKRVELSGYAELRHHHLLTVPDMDEEVITTPDNAIQILGRVWAEMEKRFKILSDASCRNLEDYNARLESGELAELFPGRAFKRLPFLVVIIDELADLLLVSGNQVEEPIGKLAQKARAVGIHLIVATQRPSADVITGSIKANFPCRIAFRVFSKTDSRVVLDMNGAEKLLGRGDMLFLPPGQPLPLRLHGPLISSKEVERIIKHVAGQPKFPAYDLPSPSTEMEVEAPDGRRVRVERDPLFFEALKLVVRHQQGSISLLQRRLRIGYARAARLIDELEQAGFVGHFDGSKAREVLATEEDLEEMGIV